MKALLLVRESSILEAHRMTITPKPPLTPCIQVCTLDAEGFCIGCGRSREEIAIWSTLTEEDRLRIMADLTRRLAEKRVRAGA